MISFMHTTNMKHYHLEYLRKVRSCLLSWNQTMAWKFIQIGARFQLDNKLFTLDSHTPEVEHYTNYKNNYNNGLEYNNRHVFIFAEHANNVKVHFSFLVFDWARYESVANWPLYIFRRFVVSMYIPCTYMLPIS